MIKTAKSIGNMFNVEYRIQSLMGSKVVYKIICVDCDDFYKGLTSRNSIITFIRRDWVKKIHFFILTVLLEKRLSSYFSIKILTVFSTKIFRKITVKI